MGKLWLGGVSLLTRFFVHSLFLLLLALSLIFLMEDGFYQNWFGFLAISCIPSLVIINAVWQFNYPNKLARIHSQPWRGLSFTLLAIALGLIVAALSMQWVGLNIAPPTPFLMMFIILSVVAVMWQLLVFEGWPFHGLSNSMKGWAMLCSSYVLAYLLYQIFFDFSLLSGIPESWRAIAPLGLFEPWTAIVYLITTLSVIFAFQLVDFRPFTNLRSKQNLCAKQPYHGLLLGSTVLLLSLLTFWLATQFFKIDPVTFMVKAPVSFLFGLFLMMDTTGNQVFLSIRQPWRGLLLIALSMMLGALMCRGYEWIMYGVLAHIVSGAPTYSAELWLANAMLSMTFPLILIYCHFFKFWPIQRYPL
ncbi:MAG: hypothetical protein H6995_00685 [Pseudomonadales bacterium]|nr:hypothetical protein [Pseudomonadales bacterium]MCP5213512.1 hypothetical protein [Pseudomonadales bacterium]